MPEIELRAGKLGVSDGDGGALVGGASIRSFSRSSGSSRTCCSRGNVWKRPWGWDFGFVPCHPSAGRAVTPGEASDAAPRRWWMRHGRRPLMQAACFGCSMRCSRPVPRMFMSEHGKARAADPASHQPLPPARFRDGADGQPVLQRHRHRQGNGRCGARLGRLDRDHRGHRHRRGSARCALAFRPGRHLNDRRRWSARVPISLLHTSPMPARTSAHRLPACARSAGR